MKSKDTTSSLFWLLVGAGVCYGGYDLELGTLHDPGSGFMFFWVGIIMMGLSLSILIQGMRMREKGEDLKSLWSGVQWKKIVLVVIALSLYAYAFSTSGFIICTVILLVFLFKAIEPQRWSVAILGAVLSTVTAYLVFQLWLGSQLPKGFLNIG